MKLGVIIFPLYNVWMFTFFSVQNSHFPDLHGLSRSLYENVYTGSQSDFCSRTLWFGKAATDFVFFSNKPTVIGQLYEPSQWGSIIAIFLSPIAPWFDVSVGAPRHLYASASSGYIALFILCMVSSFKFSTNNYKFNSCNWIGQEVLLVLLMLVVKNNSITLGSLISFTE